MRVPALVVALAFASAAHAQGVVPEPIKARVNELVARCVQAGGTLGSMQGQGRFVIPADFTGDGRTDFLISEGNVPCVGKPNLFRPDGNARLELWLGNGSDARLAFADKVMGFRVLNGPPAKLQIARQGVVCSGPARCGDELRWNAAAGRFEEVATDGRKVAARPATGAMAGTAPAVSAAAAPAGPAAPAGAVPPVLADAAARFKASCRKAILAEKPAKTDWIDGECTEQWSRVAASQPAAEMLILATPGGPGGAPSVAELRQRLAKVRWLPRAEQGSLANGQIGKFDFAIAGKGRPETASVNWTEEGAMLPLDMQSAFAARGATVTLMRCEKLGVGEGERSWSVAFPGRPPFELVVSERSAPTASAWSFYSASVRLDGAPAKKGPVNCERFW
ncbi:hypothetical protein FJQ54_16105 [Sandaracinobacter neustonicus]|uniref:Uncharacterized protein n=1 Tax=Sandaracinobacter neustonicus TaxID=1715348 RepID=A0A501XDB5_9SPHN|nr:hypothetical protein [Sandaracinobacter neustonicus]TPE58580.1 hypothetical protein FJQ54_16105 [Sandaracinobacter neustonicus]